MAFLRARLCRHGTRSALADFELLDNQNNLIASASACRFRAAHLKRHVQQNISNWRIVPWLKPHPLDGMTTAMPPVAGLIEQVRAQFDRVKHDRHTLFKEILPLTEALTLSFAWQAVRQIQQYRPLDWQQILMDLMQLPTPAGWRIC